MMVIIQLRNYILSLEQIQLLDGQAFDQAFEGDIEELPPGTIDGVS